MRGTVYRAWEEWSIRLPMDSARAGQTRSWLASAAFSRVVSGCHLSLQPKRNGPELSGCIGRNY